MAIHTELEIYRTTYTLLKLVIPLVKNMPKEVKRAFGDAIRDECIETATLIFRANVARKKESHLLDLLEHLQVLELYLRLARDLHFISIRQYAGIVKLTVSIGKQANGWRNKFAASPAA